MSAYLDKETMKTKLILRQSLTENIYSQEIDIGSEVTLSRVRGNTKQGQRLHEAGSDVTLSRVRCYTKQGQR